MARVSISTVQPRELLDSVQSIGPPAQRAEALLAVLVAAPEAVADRLYTQALDLIRVLDEKNAATVLMHLASLWGDWYTDNRFRMANDVRGVVLAFHDPVSKAEGLLPYLDLFRDELIEVIGLIGDPIEAARLFESCGGCEHQVMSTLESCDDVERVALMLEESSWELWENVPLEQLMNLARRPKSPILKTKLICKAALTSGEVERSAYLEEAIQLINSVEDNILRLECLSQLYIFGPDNRQILDLAIEAAQSIDVEPLQVEYVCELAQYVFGSRHIQPIINVAKKVSDERSRARVLTRLSFDALCERSGEISAMGDRMTDAWAKATVLSAVATTTLRPRQSRGRRQRVRREESRTRLLNDALGATRAILDPAERASTLLGFRFDPHRDGDAWKAALDEVVVLADQITSPLGRAATLMAVLHRMGKQPSGALTRKVWEAILSLAAGVEQIRLLFDYASIVGPATYASVVSHSFEIVWLLATEAEQVEAIVLIMSWDYITRDFLQQLPWSEE